MQENQFQKRLKAKIRNRLPGCLVWKQNAQQGLPDLLILYNNRWAMLECKKSANAAHQPNQDFYVNKFNEMSFAAFIFPENEEEVLDAMERSLKA